MYDGIVVGGIGLRVQTDAFGDAVGQQAIAPDDRVGIRPGVLQIVPFLGQKLGQEGNDLEGPGGGGGGRAAPNGPGFGTPSAKRTLSSASASVARLRGGRKRRSPDPPTASATATGGAVGAKPTSANHASVIDPNMGEGGPKINYRPPLIPAR